MNSQMPGVGGLGHSLICAAAKITVFVSFWSQTGYGF